MEHTQKMSLEIADYIVQSKLIENYYVYGAFGDKQIAIVVEEKLTHQERKERKESENYGITIKGQVQVSESIKPICLHIVQHKTVCLECLNELFQTASKLIIDFCKKE